MKAGTAQRIALTLLSTLLMILLGRVYEGLMVDVQAVNQKLVRRSEDMLMQLTGRSRDEVRGALRRADGSVKLAVMLLNGCDVAEAKAFSSAAAATCGRRSPWRHSATSTRRDVRHTGRNASSPGRADPVLHAGRRARCRGGRDVIGWASRLR